ncbi:hypothetical protein HA520_20860 [Azotobacter chroococcum]|uniref:Uncharacterized protein n=1 Tax=Azotobacter chroococcum TaxID=353 RepID=A0AA43Z9Z8_9GAMM|nr:hypothetical protein [Azotobacter chroococcum]NHN79693.1 hypothetical protein [Azotobacter chroococcum]
MPFYSPKAVELANDFMRDDKGSYSQLATYLDLFAPRTENWTKDSAYHLCRSHGIRSVRRSPGQPASAKTLRARVRARIIKATLEALTALSKPLTDIAPFSPKEIIRLSGASPYSVDSNWPKLEAELNKLAGL